ncbi:hypothetical protein GGS23DRAFT_356276 [Durotheca rogersii]|uniref:uncharacterized protein n=1 Tax=Durotheca rogersii TaxID=419775 RepID=UPI002220213D|nr:uncharacterized protein GGS23DRAFT_356276 [Durotheca rogersii]KAI5865817.1 hypothetical protein GGS23DRAFT_356276 [Durotheca rogersii]
MVKSESIFFQGIGAWGATLEEISDLLRESSLVDTTISLTNSEHELFLSTIPSFPVPPSRPIAQHQRVKELEIGAPGILLTLTQNALPAVEQASAQLMNTVSPLKRYLSNMVTYELLSIDTSSSLRDKCSRERWSAIASAISAVSSLGHGPRSTEGAGSAGMASADGLRGLPGVIGSPEWLDGAPTEEQVEYLRNITRLKRHVQSETHPRESRPPKVRKRDGDRSRSRNGPGSTRHD